MSKKKYPKRGTRITVLGFERFADGRGSVLLGEEAKEAKRAYRDKPKTLSKNKRVNAGELTPELESRFRSALSGSPRESKSSSFSLFTEPKGTQVQNPASKPNPSVIRKATRNVTKRVTPEAISKPNTQGNNTEFKPNIVQERLLDLASGREQALRASVKRADRSFSYMANGAKEQRESSNSMLGVREEGKSAKGSRSNRIKARGEERVKIIGARATARVNNKAAREKARALKRNSSSKSSLEGVKEKVKSASKPKRTKETKAKEKATKKLSKSNARIERLKRGL